MIRIIIVQSNVQTLLPSQSVIEVCVTPDNRNYYHNQNYTLRSLLRLLAFLAQNKSQAEISGHNNAQ